MTISTQYDPKEYEAKIYQFWQEKGVFTPSNDSKKKPFVIIMPPPNVTGVLHMGHALTMTIEDILTRRKRMQGFDALWLPGTDHAGIATQMVVERMLQKEEGKSRHDLGREAFLKKVWEWKEFSQDTIISQLKTIGASCDWTRLTFTLDENVSRAVRETFVRLYNDKLLYRDTAITHWCPRCLTALSDLEVKATERAGKLYYLRYLLKGDSSKYLTVATTRPETLLGDTAVAVHPEDERFKAFHGKKVLVPLIDREVPVITDSYVDKEFGTGALKITPGHDPNDYVVGKRHNLPVLSMFDEKAVVNEVGGPYKGLHRDKAREKVVADLEAKGQLEQIKDHQQTVPQCDRCGTVLESRVSAQWFVNAEVLAKPAIEAVEKKEIKIIPEEWEKTYFNWMRNIRPWCVSRQLWWGHRIPVWYCNSGHQTVAVKDPTKCGQCSETKLHQDDDVLDTWFSSGLWPFSTLGWPDESADMKRYYPTDVMETGFDILFFWVARMIMLGKHMTGKFPFHTIYLHPMVRDEAGQKMSKTKGNVIDPLEIVKTKGADSLRFFFAANAYHGRDVRVSDSQIEGSRNFVNKIWNASRFVMMHFEKTATDKVDTKNEINQWIWNALNETKKEVNEALDQYRFFDAANKLYHFLWDQYCYWFIEFIKSEEELNSRKNSGDGTAILVLEEILRLLHPIMPFVTEAIWQTLPIKQKVDSIALAQYPATNDKHVFPDAKRRVSRVCDVIGEIRKLRGTHGLSPAKEISQIAIIPNGGGEGVAELKGFQELIKKLGKVSKLEFATQEPNAKDFIGLILSDVKVFVPKAELGNVEEEIERKKKELADKKGSLERALAKLNNERFMASAPANVKEGVQKHHDELALEIAALEKYLGQS